MWYKGPLDAHLTSLGYLRQGCSLVQAKLLLETNNTQQDNNNSIEMIGPLPSTKEHQYFARYDCNVSVSLAKLEIPSNLDKLVKGNPEFTIVCV